MNPEPFDEWRKHYKEYSNGGISKIYDDCFKRDPSHLACSNRAVRVFLNQFKGENRIFEVGGRSGILAKTALEFTPEIKEWVNVDISKAAIDSTVVKDERYRGVWAENFRWWRTMPITGGLLLLIHVIEHLSDEDALELISKIPLDVNGIHVQAPIALKGPSNWDGFNGAHILSMGWIELNDAFEKIGFRSIKAYDGCSWKRV